MPEETKPSSQPDTESKKGGGLLGNSMAFIGEHKFMAIGIGVGLAIVAVLFANKNNSQTGSAGTAGSTSQTGTNASPDYSTAGYQSQGEAYGFDQLTQGMNNLTTLMQQYLSQTPTTNPGPGQTPPPAPTPTPSPTPFSCPPGFHSTSPSGPCVPNTPLPGSTGNPPPIPPSTLPPSSWSPPLLPQGTNVPAIMGSFFNWQGQTYTIVPGSGGRIWGVLGRVSAQQAQNTPIGPQKVLLMAPSSYYQPPSGVTNSMAAHSPIRSFLPLSQSSVPGTDLSHPGIGGGAMSWRPTGGKL